MKILITGAGGRIGSHLSQTLREEGHQVRGLGLAGEKRLVELGNTIGVEVFEGDLTDVDTLREAVAGVDAVCHLAAALTTHDVSDETFVYSNFVGTFNLLETVKELAPDLKRFVYTSSDAAYWPALTNRPLYLPIDEAHPLTAGSVYGATKVGAETLCNAYWRSYGIPYAVMRPTATASPAELVDPSSPFGRRWFVKGAIAWLESREDLGGEDIELLDKLRRHDDEKDRLFYLVDGDGASSLSMLGHPRDVAYGMRAMIDTPEAVGEAFNIGPEAPYSERALVEHLGRGLGMEVVEIPHDALRPSWYVSSAKARAVLGYQPTTTVFDMADEAVKLANP